MAESERRVGTRITSDPDATRLETQFGDRKAIARTRIPLRIIFVSDLAPATQSDWSGASRLARVDRFAFDDFMRSMAPGLRLQVPNRISSSPERIEVDLTFTSIRDFAPERLAAGIPLLSPFAAVMDALQEVIDGVHNEGSFKRRLEEAGIESDWAQQLCATLARDTKTTPEAADPLDRLLGMIYSDESASSSEGDDIMSALLGAATEGAPEQGLDRSAAGQLHDEMAGIVAAQLEAIVEEPGFRKLEAAWRSLKFLVDRIDFRREIELDVLPAGRGELAEAVYYQVLLPEHDPHQTRSPVGVIVVDHGFDNTAADITLLEDLGETGTSLQVPVLASLSPSFFGVSRPEGLARLPVLRQYLTRPEFASWNGLRQKQAANQLVLAVPPFVLRDAHGTDDASRLPLSSCSPLWGGGAVAVAAVAANSFARTGWPTSLQHPDSRLENLPIWRREGIAMPLAASLSDSQMVDLAASGFTVLSCGLNSDAVSIVHAPTVYRHPTTGVSDADAEAQLHASLPSRLFLTRAAQFVLSLQREPERDIGMSGSDLAARFAAFLQAPGHAAPDESVSVEPVAEAGASSLLFTVRLRSPQFILDPPVTTVLGVELPRRQPGML